mgnify:CR=1 FL=1
MVLSILMMGVESSLSLVMDQERVHLDPESWMLLSSGTSQLLMQIEGRILRMSRELLSLKILRAFVLTKSSEDSRES